LTVQNKPKPVDPRIQELGEKIGTWLGIVLIAVCLVSALLVLFWNLGPASYLHLPALQYTQALGFSGLLIGVLAVVLAFKETKTP
jgi:hypothetical protein